MKQLEVDLGQRSYPIYIGSDILGSSLLLQHIRAQQVMVVTNNTIAPLYLQAVTAACTGKQVDVCLLPDGEQHKTLNVQARIYDELLAKRHHRTTTIIALGGGVIGDMAGFAAATYQRGTHFIQLPTTLLAQVDSSVGGKTGVNHPQGKNMIGAFHQPQAVLIDTNTLHTLPPREYNAGMAEIIKYGLIADAPFYQWLHQNSQALAARNSNVVSEAIQRSCQNKAAIVAADERESGIRAILNLGHTFGHAIETATAYGHWLHGEAIAAGMVIALRLSALLNLINDDEVQALVDLLQAFKLPVTAPADMTIDQFMNLMAVDKKATAGKIRFILLDAIGHAVIRDDVPVELIEKAIRAG